MTAQHPQTSWRSADVELDLQDLVKHYEVRRSGLPFRHGAVVRAVDGVTVQVRRGETFGIVGESGSGKSTLGRLAVRLERPTSGRVIFEGLDITSLTGERLRRMRSAMQVVFQDPLGSLNPRMTVAEIVGEPIRVFHGLRGAALRAKVEEVLSSVGLDVSRIDAYPRSLSGGQRQRVGIARAVGVGPRLLLADEAVSALDVSVQAQIVNLFVELREELGLTYLFIAHGLPVVRQIATRVGVMYLGRMVETGTRDEVFDSPVHPYTQALIAAAPSPDPSLRRRRIVLAGEPPSPTALPSGCRFRTRCPRAEDVCADVAPRPVLLSPGRVVECHFAGTG